MSNSYSVNKTLFDGFLATHWYKVCSYTMNIDGANPPGTFRVDARSRHNQTSNYNSVKGTLFTGFLATQWYNVRPYAIDIHEVHLCYESGIYADAFRLDARFLYN